jgi:hypothetical protein
MKKRFILSALACAAVLGTTTLQAKTDTKTMMETQLKKHTMEQKKAPKEVAEGIQNTFKALHAIEQNKLKEAEKLLAEADQKFTTALKNDPSLDLLPLEETLMAFSYTGSSKDIQAALDLSVQLIKAHDTQVARSLMMTLKDELDINIVSIPMKLYPVATKKALEALKKGDKNTALAALAEGFGMLINTQIIIPTPLLVAQDLALEASKLDKSKKEEALKLLAGAKEELARAELLGYTKKHDAAYKLIQDDIEKVEKEIKGKNIVEKLYEKLVNDFKKLVGDTRHEEHKVNNPASSLHDSVAPKAQKAIQDPASVKGEAAAKAKVEEAQDKLKFEAKEKASEFEKEVKKDLQDTVKPASH